MNRILIAGLGNIFLGDDAFGIEAVRLLANRPLPEGVRVVDFGIRAYDLAYALTDGYDLVILVDAVSRGAPPGTVYLIEPEVGQSDPPHPAAIDAHSLNPATVLQMARSLGGCAERIYLVGCEPAALEEEIGLSEPVRVALPQAVAMIESTLHELLLTQTNNKSGLGTGLLKGNKQICKLVP
jgi:hydrogenase maturation protease